MINILSKLDSSLNLGSYIFYIYVQKIPQYCFLFWNNTIKIIRHFISRCDIPNKDYNLNCNI